MTSELSDSPAAFEPPLRRALLAAHRVLAGPPIESSYRLTRTLLLRALASLYLLAFIIAAHQLVPLIGSEGLTPVAPYLDAIADFQRSRSAAAWKLPSVFWLDHSDAMLRGVALFGVALASLALLGVENAFVWLLLWACYMSITNVGQRWYAFGWEMQLLETGFIAVLWCPWLSLRPRPEGARSSSAPSRVPLWCYRWLIFRVMLGAGLIKLRGDPCWTELSCLDYHFETQPIPGPLSPYFHALPPSLLAAGVAFNHIAELLLPWFVFGPRRARHIAGALIIAFQLTLILSGNLAFLNWLTIIPALACFDDQLLRRMLPPRWRARYTDEPEPPARAGIRWLNYAFAALVVWLSLPVVVNLLSNEQAMNRSFDRLGLVNTYGAFGGIGRERVELIIEGTASEDPNDPSAAWLAYAFECKPGAVERRPCWITPYHQRLDWLAWFAALEVQYGGRISREDWLFNLVYKLLRHDLGARELLDETRDPFPDAPPRWIRVEVFRYRLMPPGSPAVWQREWVGELMPAISAEDEQLRAHLRNRGWLRE